MKSKKLRVIIPLCILVFAAVGFAVYFASGTLSGFGFDGWSLICPIGALGALLASKTFIPQAVFSLIFAVVAILLLGRFFCGWICPVPLVGKLRNVFAKKQDSTACGETEGGCRKCGNEACAGGKKRGNKADARHFVLGSALLSTAIFGFPVFCLICPIGLTFASIFLIIALFGAGDVTWAVIAAPLLLLIEVVFFKKWCHTFCPLGALMSLVSKGNKTLQVQVDPEKCIEHENATCGVCARVCEEGINPRHSELSSADWNECTKCRACVEACPGKAIKIPFVKKQGCDKN